jgi:hypothetical protein
LPPPADVTAKQLLRYVKLEEDESTADLLKSASFLYVGVAMVDGADRYYWSYPTFGGIGWVCCTTDGSLRIEVEVPAGILAATRPRGEHPAKRLPEPLPPPDRTPIPAPVWIPGDRIPAVGTFPVWEAPTTLAHAARAFRAIPQRVNVGYPSLTFLVKLTSGRYAWLSAPARKPMPVEIALEMAQDARSRQRDESGFVHLADLLEILGAMGLEYEPRGLRMHYEWR